MRKQRLFIGLGSTTAAFFAHVALAQSEEANPVNETISAFNEICVNNATSLSASREAAISSDWEFAAKGELPGYGKAAPMQAFASEKHGLELVLRPNKRRYGCIVLRDLPATQVMELKTRLSELHMLEPTGKHESKRDQYKWALENPKGSTVVLSIYAERQPQSIILALESKGDPN